MNRELKFIIQKDIFRYYGKNKIPIKDRILKNIPLNYIICYRKANYYYKKNRILKYYYIIKLRKMKNKYFIEIPYTTDIDEGFYIGHLGNIAINPMSKLGKNINIAAGVVIGKTNRGEKKGAPTIRDNVWIGTNAVIVGKIIIGEDVLIAANSYINFDVPSHSIVIGNPAKVINKYNATEEYINNKI